MYVIMRQNGRYINGIDKVKGGPFKYKTTDDISKAWQFDYYVNAFNVRDVYEIKDGRIIEMKED